MKINTAKQFLHPFKSNTQRTVLLCFGPSRCTRMTDAYSWNFSASMALYTKGKRLFRPIPWWIFLDVNVTVFSPLLQAGSMKVTLAYSRTLFAVAIYISFWILKTNPVITVQQISFLDQTALCVFWVGPTHIDLYIYFLKSYVIWLNFQLNFSPVWFLY